MRWPDESTLITVRRDLHAHPELSHQENRTAGVVAERLRALGLAPREKVAGHGLYADIEGALPGPHLLLRADMDALPIQEVSGRPYGSRTPGVMHACGHDVHTTIALGVAESLVSARSQLAGRVRVLFQPAEEAAPPPGEVIGAERMVQEGALAGPDVDAAFAFHVMPTLEVGVVAGTGGAVWASSDVFSIEVEGWMSHGAYPHEGRDAILASSQIVLALQHLVSRQVDPRDAAVVSVCEFLGGNSTNILPANVRMRGLVRALRESTRRMLVERVDEVVEGVARAYGCRAKVTWVRGAHLTSNAPTLERTALEAVARAGIPVRQGHEPQLGAEDFAAFSRRVPSAYLFLGTRNEERGITSPLHTPRFDVDEACLLVGVRAMTAALLHVASTWSSAREPYALGVSPA